MKHVGQYIPPYRPVYGTETPENIFALYEQGAPNRSRFETLQQYYLGNAAIFERAMDKGKPNHRLGANYARYICSLASGYFLGKPVSYSMENPALKRELEAIYLRSGEADHNYELAKAASICGVAYELLWLDEAANIRMSRLDPRSLTVVYRKDFDRTLDKVIREYTVQMGQKEEQRLEVYTNTVIETYCVTGSRCTLLESREHYFSSVPIVEYKNNEELQGDFETVISLMDAYNLTLSDSANDLSYFTDAYLALIGYGGTTTEDVARMREDRVLLLEDGGDAKFLTKSVSDTVGENYKSRLQEDIHRISMVPNLTDESFAGNLSGVAIEYKLFGLEQLAVTKERKFEKALKRRLALLVNMLKTKGADADKADVQFVFHRNIPQNEAEIVDTATKLAGLVSRRTMLKTLPMVRDIEGEMD